MGTSGNPAKRAEEEAQKAEANKPVISSAQSFKKKRGQVLELPSGNVVRAQKAGLQAFIMKGNVPNSLMTIVGEALEKGQTMDINKMVGANDGQIDMDMVTDMYEMTNSLVIASLVEPKVHPVPTDADLEVWNTKNPDNQVSTPDELRDDELLYVDEVDDEDKMFLFQWCSGGTDDVATFREEARASMDALAEKQGAISTP